MKKRKPLSEFPTDWLRAQADYVKGHSEVDSDEAFMVRCDAAQRMNVIDKREGYVHTAHPKEAAAELARRGVFP